MLHLIYILAFTVIAFLAVSNLIRSLITVSMGTQQSPGTTGMAKGKHTGHPELFDDNGTPINEPLMVMRTVNMDDAKKRLDALYEASPSNTTRDIEES